VNYTVRNRSEEDRTAFIRPFQEALKTDSGQKPIEDDDERRRKIFLMLLNEVKGLGEGSEKGAILSSHIIVSADFCKEIEGFFNLIYSHLFTLFPSDSPSQKQRLAVLLQTISDSPSENTSLKYKLYGEPFPSCSSPHILLRSGCQTCSTLSHENLPCDYPFTRLSCKSQRPKMRYRLCRYPGRT